ncbi:hypothetical protein [Anaerocolumna xylanovorans]|uniref:Uncharacterized protein n=1 Tax=Anaerocolumna xylanovorans DSM 12503 TaxID=1121345 RepID=A0A1M7Y3R3_9FIRM|nr:hypothetical protein [Anaerocolumna xylanovorans]SHO46870.1 hypothetical protein SAMN02745217_01318 [Anaerocolumna xylanovorans DSM 12503]
MDDSYNLNLSNTIAFAKELTIKAIENGLITASSDSKETAKSITDFYKKALETINND